MVAEFFSGAPNTTFPVVFNWLGWKKADNSACSRTVGWLVSCLEQLNEINSCDIAAPLATPQNSAFGFIIRNIERSLERPSEIDFSRDPQNAAWTFLAQNIERAGMLRGSTLFFQPYGRLSPTAEQSGDFTAGDTRPAEKREINTQGRLAVIEQEISGINLVPEFLLSESAAIKKLVEYFALVGASPASSIFEPDYRAQSILFTVALAIQQLVVGERAGAPTKRAVSTLIKQTHLYKATRLRKAQ